MSSTLYFLPSTLYCPSGNRGDRRLTFPNDLMGMGLLRFAIAQTYEFSADTFFAMGAGDT